MKMLAPLILSAVPLLSPQPIVVNGRLQPAESLSQAPANGWIGYAITTNRTVSTCGCRLKSDNEDITDVDRGPSEAFLFLQMRDGRPARVRFFTPTCEVNAGGETVTWIANVSQAESIAYLRRQIEGGDTRKSGAVFALSMHDGATDALIDLARRSPE